MTTAIVFSSKHGATADIARRIASKLGSNTALFDLADGQPDLTQFDQVVLGTAIYAGSPMPLMKAFTQTASLGQKRVALFACGMETDPAKRNEELKTAFPAELAQQAITAALLGGRFQFVKMSIPERFIIRRITKVKTDTDTINDDAISTFVQHFDQR